MTQENPTIKDTASAREPGEANGAAENDSSPAGQGLRGLGRATRRLPRPESGAARQARHDAATRERVAQLVAALGDVGHQQHGPAVDELARIGDPAVPALIDALSNAPSWLVAYRAAEALGQIGDGRASGALLNALNHPNSNVRWSAIRALAQIGDARSLLALRRVARDDRGKTSWGEAVASTAQSALDQMQTQSMLLHGLELIKTAVACVLMIVSLIVMFSVVSELRQAWSELGMPPRDAVAVVRNVEPTVAPEPTLASDPQPTAAPEPVADVSGSPTAEPASPSSAAITGTAQLTANVRQEPRQNSQDIGEIASGDVIVITGISEDGQWYRVRLGDEPAPSSRISGDEGWVFSALISRPEREPPVVTP